MLISLCPFLISSCTPGSSSIYAPPRYILYIYLHTQRHRAPPHNYHMQQQTCIHQAISRTATFKLKRILAAEIAARMCISSPAYIREAAFLGQIVAPTAPNSEQIKRLISIIYGCAQKRLAGHDPSASPSQINQNAKDETRAMISELIKAEASGIQMDQSSQQIQVNAEEESPLPDSLSPPALHEPLCALPEVQQNEMPVPYFLPESLKPAIEDRPCKEEEGQQQWKMTQELAIRSGHFLYGDSIACIREVLAVEGELFGAVEWRKREGEALRQSIMELETIREHCPRVLATFLEEYEGRLRRDRP